MIALDDRLLRRQRQFLSLFAEIPVYAHHEGDRWAYIKVEGDEQELGYKELAGEFTLKVDDVSYMSPANILSLVDSAI